MEDSIVAAAGVDHDAVLSPSSSKINDTSKLIDQGACDDVSDIDKEFENYLNENEEFDTVPSSYADENKTLLNLDGLKRGKLSKLENTEYSAENLKELRQMALDKYGFMNKKFRRKAWPILILSSTEHARSLDKYMESCINQFNQISESQIKSHVYYNQVKLDVIRTLKRFPPEISDKLRLKLQNQLIDIIVKILIKSGGLHYYQGYHDICLTFLLVTGANECLPLIEKITQSHLTCFMETTMETTVKLLFNMMPLIDKKNPKLAEHIQRAEVGIIFGLSWLITWYSHVMENLKIILRLYDLFIASDPLMPIYLAAIIVSEKSYEVLSMDCDMAILHTVITKFPSKIEEIEKIEEYITLALNLFEEYPPSKLPELGESWLIKCKIIQEDLEREKAIEQENKRLRRRKNKNNNNNNDSESDYNISTPGNKLAKRKKFALRNKNPNNKIIANNRFLFGLTFTAGVVAVAMLAMNTNVVKEPQDLISKFYHLLYKDF